MARSKPIRESAVEAALVRYAKEHDIWTRKFASPARRGVPDRIFMKNGLVLFMEIKRPGEEPTPLQEHELQLIRNHKGNAEWADSVERGVVWLAYFFNDAL